MELLNDEINEISFDESIKNKIKEDLNNKVYQFFFPLIAKQEKDFLTTLMLYLLDYIYQAFYFNNFDEFLQQLRENNYQDYKSILLLLLPYLDKFPERNIKSLNEIIYFENNIKLDNFKELNLMELKRSLKYSNFLINLLNQYEDDFTLDFLKVIVNAFELTLTTIRQTCYKLLPNWVNIIPYSNKKVENTQLIELQKNNLFDDTINFYQKINGEIIYIMSTKKINNQDIENIIKKELFNPKGIWIGEYYNVMINFFYLSVVNCKFLIYNFYDDNSFSFKKEVIYGIDILYQNFKPLFPFDLDYDNILNNPFKKLLFNYLEKIKDKPRELEFFKIILFNFFFK